MEDIKAVANAIEKSAECATQALQTGEKAGGFVARVFKEPIEVGAAIVSDRMKLARLRRLDAMADEVGEILRRRNITDSRAVPPKLGIPVLEAAVLEDAPELQKLWSRLLANAMDPNFKDEVRVAYSDIIKSMNAIDARVLFLMYNSLRALNKLALADTEDVHFRKDIVTAKLGISAEEYAISIENLMRLRCVAPLFRRVAFGKGLKTNGGTNHVTSYSGSDEVVATPLGIRFVEACSDGADLKADVVDVSALYTHRIDVGLTPEDIGLKTAGLW